MKVKDRLAMKIVFLLLAGSLVACGKGEEKGENKGLTPGAPEAVIHKTTTPATAVPPLAAPAEQPPATAPQKAGENGTAGSDVAPPSPATSPAPANQESDLPESPTAAPPQASSPAALPPAPAADLPKGKEEFKSKSTPPLAEGGIEPLETPQPAAKSAEAAGPRRSALPVAPGPERRSDRLKMALPKQ